MRCAFNCCCSVSGVSRAAMFRSSRIVLILLIFGSLSNGESETRDERPATNIPTFTSREETFHVRSGETVEMPCQVEDLGQYVILWRFNRTKVLFAANIRIQNDERLHLNRHNLVISNVTADHTGEYLCEVSTNPQIELIHHLLVLSAPRIKIHPETGQIVVKKGDSIRLECESRSEPKPQIQWKRINASLPEHHQQSETELIINRADRFDTGNYQCIASNQIGNISNNFIVQVLYAPEIEVKEKIVHGEGTTAINVTCHVTAEPSASIIWIRSRDGRQILPSEKFVLRRIDSTVTLTIKQISETDYDNYTCIANNTIGQSSSSVEVSGRPSLARFVSSPLGSRDTEYELKWELISVPPIHEYSIRFRSAVIRDNESSTEWKRFSVKPDDSEGPKRFQTFVLTDLAHATSYEVEVTAENRFGKSRSDLFAFSTSGSANRIALSIISIVVACVLLQIV